SLVRSILFVMRLICSVFFYSRYGDHLDLHSFPTRRSSDLREAKLKALQLTLDKLDKTYGKGTVMKLGDSAVEEVEAIPSGSLRLDRKSTRLNSSHVKISYAVFCLKKKKKVVLNITKQNERA